ncbi:glycosyltransferase family 2 protein [Patiriisocius hiemis]|uniref:Glycosyltransferase n=1 Tax=Patiriisocius hiemis TaxID=3075604 RepID=A0ABU2YEU5_9FLAO|nr:glycosyltransferase [Constantimarinum sp. W242]MDT0556714.1 glycosyltransferase [Constantimarinum sp. W242]
MPELSIIIPLYNKEKDIENTLKSVLLQSYSDFEVVVVNDGSTDKSESVVSQIKDDRIKLFSKKNEGVSKTRNFGVSKAIADHIVFLDADDYWYPNHLKNLKDLIKKFPEQGWYATAYEKKHNKNLIVPIQSPVMEKEESMFLINNYFKNSLKDNLAWTSAVCMKKIFFNSLNGFDTSITMGAGEDTDLWIRAALASEIGFCKIVSATHNLEGTNRISNTPTNDRVFLNLDNYEDFAKEDMFLQKFLDLNRYSIALQYKLSGNFKTSNKISKKINSKNLSFTQRNLLKLPRSILVLLIKTQKFLGKKGYRLSSYK